MITLYYVSVLIKLYPQPEARPAFRLVVGLQCPNLLWNKLPFEIRAFSDVNLFKSKSKTFLFKKVYDI